MMKRKSLFFIGVGLLLLIVSCKRDNVTVTGSVADAAFEGKGVYLAEYTDTALIVLDSAIVQNGAFTMKTNTVSPFGSLYLEKVGSAIQTEVKILVEPGAFNVIFDTITQVSGSPVNEFYTVLRNNLKQNMLEFNKVREQYYAEEEEVKIDSLQKILWDMDAQSVGLYYNFSKENMQNALGRFIFLKSYSMFSDDQQKELLELTDDGFLEKEKVKKIVEQLYSKANDDALVGKPYVDFTLNNTKGEAISLSDYVGNKEAVLLFFWSPECDLCVKEMPEFKELYAAYKGKGLALVGVSLGKDADSWLDFIQNNRITEWVNLLDTRSFSSPIADDYHLSGIPAAYLINKEGIIVMEKESPENISSKIEEQLLNE